MRQTIPAPNTIARPTFTLALVVPKVVADPLRYRLPRQEPNRGYRVWKGRQ